MAEWTASLAASLEGRRLDGLHVVIDCANGAASRVAPEVLAALGARVEVLHADPDGTNINADCGSTHPADLQAAVVAAGASAGLAFDGDADRVLAVDETGALVDGDHLIALFAHDLRARGRLRGDLVVVTVMTNLGFRRAMAADGIEVVETPVGRPPRPRGAGPHRWLARRRAVRAPRVPRAGHHRRRPALGAAAARPARPGRAGPSRTMAAAAMTRLPQVLTNVAVAHRRPDVADAVAAEVAAEEAALAGQGRILIRPSGTEPLVRVMVEAPSHEAAEAAADRLAEAVRRACAD